MTSGAPRVPCLPRFTPLLPLREWARRGTQAPPCSASPCARGTLQSPSGTWSTRPRPSRPCPRSARSAISPTSRLRGARRSRHPGSPLPRRPLKGEPAFALTFERMAVFDTEPLVLWLSPSRDQRLIDAHARLHALVDPALCDPHYLPERWTPHLTVATAIAASQRDAALDFARRSFAPFTLTFDVAECVSWPPVRVLQTRPLK